MAWSLPKIGAVATPVASGDLTLAEPSGIAQGDLMVACISYRSNAAFSTPSGWTKAEEENTGNTSTVSASAISSLVMYYGIRGASAPGLTFTRTAGDVAFGHIVSYTPTAGTPTLDTSSSNTLATAAVTSTTGSLTTANAGELIVAFTSGARSNDVRTFDAATDPTTASAAMPVDTTNAPSNGTWRQRTASKTTTGADAGLGFADALRATAGATGTIQSTLDLACFHAMAALAFYEAAAAINGTLSTTLAAATLSSSSTVAIKGTTTSTLAAATLSSSSTVAIKGTTTSTLAAATLSSASTLALKAALASTLGDATLVSTSTLAIKGALTATLADVALASTGTVAIKAAASITLADATLSATSTLAIKGTGTSTLADATLASTGTVALAGTLAATLDAATLSSASTLALKAALAATLDAATLVATATIGATGVTGTASITLADATLAAASTLALKGTLSATLGDVTLLATSTSGGEVQAETATGGGGGEYRPSSRVREYERERQKARKRLDGHIVKAMNLAEGVIEQKQEAFAPTPQAVIETLVLLPDPEAMRLVADIRSELEAMQRYAEAIARMDAERAIRARDEDDAIIALLLAA